MDSAEYETNKVLLAHAYVYAGRPLFSKLSEKLFFRLHERDYEDPTAYAFTDRGLIKDAIASLCELTGALSSEVY